MTLLIGAGTSLKLWLMERQRRTLAHHRGSVPTPFEDHFTLEQHDKAVDYGRSRLRWNQCSLLLRAVVLVLLLNTTWLGHWDHILWQTFPQWYLQPLLFLGGIGLVEWLIHLPLSWNHHFVLEAQHGFNRMTPRLFWLDQARGAVLTIVLGSIVLLPLLKLMHSYPVTWILPAFIFWASLQLLLIWAWPQWIAPLFNSFTPLKDAELARSIENLVGKAGFRAKGVYVMDASKRSGHGNAYFTGFGKAKRIVFFDTLLEKLDASGTLAVLAHELGHLHHKHIIKSLVLGLFIQALGFLALGWLQIHSEIFVSLGLTPTAGPLFFLATQMAPWILVPLTPLSAWFSRRNEYQADRYAVLQTGSHALGQALLELHRQNAASPVNDPLYSLYFHSHPPLVERLQGMGWKATGP